MAKVLETNGMVCPFPLEEAKAAMNELTAGEELMIHFDCTQATESIPRWAAKEGHTITNFEQTGNAEWQIVLKKGN